MPLHVLKEMPSNTIYPGLMPVCAGVKSVALKRTAPFRSQAVPDVTVPSAEDDAALMFPVMRLLSTAACQMDQLFKAELTGNPEPATTTLQVFDLDQLMAESGGINLLQV